MKTRTILCVFTVTSLVPFILAASIPVLARQAGSQSATSSVLYLPVLDHAYPLPRILFYANWTGNKDVFVMDASGSNLKNLTEHPADDSHPTWSPDGSKIAFASDRIPAGVRSGTNRPVGVTAYNVFLMNPDGSGVTQLTFSGCGNSQPDWSPDGSKLAYVSCDTGTNQVYVINVDGSGSTNLSKNRAFDSDPAWSPDGSRIAYVSYRNDNADIYLMNADGSNQTRLTMTDGVSEWSPDWSPDGQRLIYDSFRSGNSDLFIINADGSGETNLTNSSTTEFFPSWSPDGWWIVFCGVDGTMGIEMIKINGNSRSRLNFSGLLQCEPAWGP